MEIAEQLGPDEEPRRERWLVRAELWLRGKLGPAAPALPLLLFLLSWLYLNAALNARLWVEDGLLLAALTPSPEALGALALLCALAFAGRKPRPALLLLVTLLLGVLRLAYLPEEVMQLVWARPFELHPDGGLFWDAVTVLAERIDMGTIVLVIAASSASAAVIAFFARQALALSSNFFSEKRARVGFAVAAGLLAALGLAGALPFGASLAWEAGRQVASRLGAADRRGEVALEIENARDRSRLGPETLAGLEGRHVLLVFVESYSAGALTRPGASARLRTVLEELSREVGEDGWHARSALLESPDVSGISELAQVTVLAGVPIASRSDLGQLRATDLRTLAHRFGSSGYRTARALPGETRERRADAPGADPTVGFHMDYFAWRLGYQGPAFGASPMPDQFVLDRLFRLELEDAEEPVFAMVALTGSQAPFDRQPPYVQDWSTVGDGALFSELEPAGFEVSFPELEGAEGPWVASLESSIRVLGRFLVEVVPDRPERGRGRRRRRPRPEPLVLVLGDHPPPAPVAGRSDPPLVPAHAFCRDEAVLEPFAQRAWAEGTMPATSPPFERTATLRWLLETAFGVTPESEEGGEPDVR